MSSSSHFIVVHRLGSVVATRPYCSVVPTSYYDKSSWVFGISTHWLGSDEAVILFQIDFGVLCPPLSNPYAPGREGIATALVFPCVHQFSRAFLSTEPHLWGHSSIRILLMHSRFSKTLHYSYYLSEKMELSTYFELCQYYQTKSQGKLSEESRKCSEKLSIAPTGSLS